MHCFVCGTEARTKIDSITCQKCCNEKWESKFNTGVLVESVKRLLEKLEDVPSTMRPNLGGVFEESHLTKIALEKMSPKL